jgi:hypothetical protein
MKKSRAVFFVAVSVALWGVAIQSPVVQSISFVPLANAQVNAGTRAFLGEISDGQCAANGSHDAVMKKASVNSPANCVRGCAKKHGLVLVDAATKTVYKLDDLDKAFPFAAQKVKVTGTLTKATNTIHLVSIEAAAK